MDIDVQSNRRAFNYGNRRRVRGKKGMATAQVLRRVSMGMIQKMILRLTMMMRKGGKKHLRKSFLDRDVDSEIVHKKATM